MDAETEIHTLKQKVAELERKLNFVMDALRLQYSDVPASQDGEVIELIKRGHLLEAIKLYREQTGVGLKEAKDAVDDLQRRLRGR